MKDFVDFRFEYERSLSKIFKQDQVQESKELKKRRFETLKSFNERMKELMCEVEFNLGPVIQLLSKEEAFKRENFNLSENGSFCLKRQGSNIQMLRSQD